MNYKWVKMSNLDLFKNIEKNMRLYRAFSGLLKNQEIGQLQQKLWPFK